MTRDQQSAFDELLALVRLQLLDLRDRIEAAEKAKGYQPGSLLTRKARVEDAIAVAEGLGFTTESTEGAE